MKYKADWYEERALALLRKAELEIDQGRLDLSNAEHRERIQLTYSRAQVYATLAVASATDRQWLQ